MFTLISGWVVEWEGYGWYPGNPQNRLIGDDYGMQKMPAPGRHGL